MFDSPQTTQSTEESLNQRSVIGRDRGIPAIAGQKMRPEEQNGGHNRAELGQNA